MKKTTEMKYLSKLDQKEFSLDEYLKINGTNETKIAKINEAGVNHIDL